MIKYECNGHVVQISRATDKREDDRRVVTYSHGANRARTVCYGMVDALAEARRIFTQAVARVTVG